MGLRVWGLGFRVWGLGFREVVDLGIYVGIFGAWGFYDVLRLVV